MSYEETLERVIQRLDSEEKEKDKRIAELEKALATSFEFLSFSRLSDCVFYENHKHLIKEQK
tara:strand:- start:704 stop:889 length:186 start_codon:yes stop_codon:yes gene_type:complete